MDYELLSVCAAENGYVVHVCGREKDEPAPPAGSGMMISSSEDEMYVATNLTDLLKFLNDKIPTLVPRNADEEYTNSFTEAVQNE